MQSRERIAPASDGDECLRADELAQSGNLHLDVRLFDHQPRPDDGQQLFLADDAVSALYERDQ